MTAPFVDRRRFISRDAPPPPPVLPSGDVDPETFLAGLALHALVIVTAGAVRPDIVANQAAELAHRTRLALDRLRVNGKTCPRG